MQSQNKGPNKMASEPITKLLFSMSLPAIIAMLVQALYNFVDSLYVARLGEDALTAISLAFPIQMIIIACFVGLGVGVTSVISRKLGEKNSFAATIAAEHGFILFGIMYVFIAILGAFFIHGFFARFTDEQSIIQYGSQYIRIIMLFSFGRMFAQGGISILQGTGDMIRSMKAQLIGAISNIILDPIMIFGLFGFPRLEVAGAAIATVSGQIISMLYVFTVIYKGNLPIKFNLRKFKYSKETLRSIVSVALPVSVMQGLASVMIAGLNVILVGFTETAVAVLGVYFKIQSFVFMPIFGLSQGAMPILGYNYGAKNRDRFIETIKVSSVIAFLYMGLGTIVFQVFPVELFGLFKSSQEMTDIGVTAFRIVSWMFPFAGISIMVSTSFQGMGEAHISLIISFIRQIVVLLPLSYILGQIAGLDAVWWGVIGSEIVGLTAVLLFFKKEYNSKLKDLSPILDTKMKEVEDKHS